MLYFSGILILIPVVKIFQVMDHVKMVVPSMAVKIPYSMVLAGLGGTGAILQTLLSMWLVLTGYKASEGCRSIMSRDREYAPERVRRPNNTMTNAGFSFFAIHEDPENTESNGNIDQFSSRTGNDTVGATRKISVGSQESQGSIKRQNIQLMTTEQQVVRSTPTGNVENTHKVRRACNRYRHQLMLYKY